MFRHQTEYTSNREVSRLPRRAFISQLATLGLCLSACSKWDDAAASKSAVSLACQTNAWPFESGLPGLIDILKTVKALGFTGYETAYRNLEGSFANPEPAKAKLEETGLTCAGVHVAAPHLYKPETGIPELDFLKTIATGSSALGAENLILSGRGVGLENGQLNQVLLRQKIAALLEVGQYCQDLGLTLTYHNHVDDFLNDGAEIDELLSADSKGLIKVWLCTHNATRAGTTVADYFAARHDSIVGIHITNILHQEPGEKHFEAQSLHTEIQKANWKGWLIIEEERTRKRPDWPQTPAIEKSRQHIGQIFGV